MNKITDIKRPWFLSFSFGRALQNSSIKAWGGKDENVEAGQKAFLTRALANSESQLGQYKGSTDKAANESLFEAKYSYWSSIPYLSIYNTPLLLLLSDDRYLHPAQNIYIKSPVWSSCTSFFFFLWSRSFAAKRINPWFLAKVTTASNASLQVRIALHASQDTTWTIRKAYAGTVRHCRHSQTVLFVLSTTEMRFLALSARPICSPIRKTQLARNAGWS